MGWRAVAVALATVLLATGCSASPAGTAASAGSVTDLAPASSSPPAPSSTPTVDPQAQAEAAVLAAYATFMDARNKSLNDPRKPPDRRLFQVSVPPARDDLYNLVLYYRRNGMLIRGVATSVPGPHGIELGRDRATFQDCVDGTDAVPIVRASGKSAMAPNQKPRLWVDVGATWIDGEWAIDRWDVKRDSPC